MAELTPEERFEIGRKLGTAVVNIFEAIARLEGVPYEEAVDQWVAAYVASRIIDR